MVTWTDNHSVKKMNLQIVTFKNKCCQVALLILVSMLLPNELQGSQKLSETNEGIEFQRIETKR